MHVCSRGERPRCSGCGKSLWSNGERQVELVDLPAFGRPVRLVWYKRGRRCGRLDCGAGSFTGQRLEIALSRVLRATRCAGRGEAIQDAAAALGCDWHTVNASVCCWGQALSDAAPRRLSAVRYARRVTDASPRKELLSLWLLD